MSDMKKLLESISKFSFANPNQKPGDMVRGTEVAGKGKHAGHPFKDRLVGSTSESADYCDACDRPASECVCDDELKESLMQEYKYFVKEADPVPTASGTAPASPVANINPAGTGTAATNTAPQQTGNAPAAPAAGQPAQPAAPAAGQTQPAATAAKPAAPGQPAAQPAAGQQAPKPGAPAAGTVTPPNPQKVKQDTDALTGILNNPAHPMNAQLQALVKKAGSIPK